MPPGSIVGLVLGLLVFVLILGGFVYLSKRISKGTVFSGKRIRVIERLMVSRDASVLLLQIGLRLFVVGAGRDGVNLLSELSASDFAEAQKSESPRGFMSRFKSNLRANVTQTNKPEADTSFAELLQKMKDPVSGSAEGAGNAGHPHTADKPETPRYDRYQNEIENMTRLSQPDALDRRAHNPPPRYETPSRRPAPVPSPAEPDPKNEKERAERIDQLLDLVSQRQARLDDRNNTGDKG
ncbi:MAG: flagellar biosynthetic protein FliO [Oscillospiraceae bacterium]|jgi:flagellar biogenesis protein FliO|nr:flagellar biosynthetic protein FliO [Oscillospiraceae bacterium]